MRRRARPTPDAPSPSLFDAEVVAARIELSATPRSVHEIYDGLIAIQHRGQDAAGILTFDGRFHVKKGEGLVRDIFSSAALSGAGADCSAADGAAAVWAAAGIIGRPVSRTTLVKADRIRRPGRRRPSP